MAAVQRIGVVGAGQMGQGIAQVAAQAGLDVLIVDAAPDFAHSGVARIKKQLDRLVEKSKLEAAGTIQLAPGKETADAARDTMKKRKLNGFYLAVAVDKFDYSNGNLRVKVKIGVFTYPGKSLLGNVDKTLTKEGVSSGDKSSEDQMLDLAAGLASEQFAQNASAFL